MRLRRLVSVLAVSIGAAVGALGVQAHVVPAFGDQSCTENCPQQPSDNTPPGCAPDQCATTTTQDPSQPGPASMTAHPLSPAAPAASPASPTPGGPGAARAVTASPAAGPVPPGAAPAPVPGSPMSPATDTGSRETTTGVRAATSRATLPDGKPRGFPGRSMAMTIVLCALLTGAVITTAGPPRRRRG